MSTKPRASSTWSGEVLKMRVGTNARRRVSVTWPRAVILRRLNRMPDDSTSIIRWFEDENHEMWELGSQNSQSDSSWIADLLENENPRTVLRKSGKRAGASFELTTTTEVIILKSEWDASASSFKLRTRGSLSKRCILHFLENRTVGSWDVCLWVCVIVARTGPTGSDGHGLAGSTNPNLISVIAFQFSRKNGLVSYRNDAVSSSESARLSTM